MLKYKKVKILAKIRQIKWITIKCKTMKWKKNKNSINNLFNKILSKLLNNKK